MSHQNESPFAWTCFRGVAHNPRGPPTCWAPAQVLDHKLRHRLSQWCCFQSSAMPLLTPRSIPVTLSLATRVFVHGRSAILIFSKLSSLLSFSPPSLLRRNSLLPVHWAFLLLLYRIAPVPAAHLPITALISHAGRTAAALCKLSGVLREWASRARVLSLAFVSGVFAEPKLFMSTWSDPSHGFFTAFDSASPSDGSVCPSGIMISL